MEDLKILERWGGVPPEAEVEGDITEIISAEIEMALRKMKNRKEALYLKTYP